MAKLNQLKNCQVAAKRDIQVRKRRRPIELHGYRASHLQEFKVHFQLHVNLEILWAYLL